MRKKLSDILCRCAWVGSTAALCVHLTCIEPVLAAEDPVLSWRKVKITGYCLTGTTASGIETQDGICAYRSQDIGKTCRVYDADGELIGEFLIADTGKKGGGVRAGTTVDIWKPTRAECLELTQHGYIEILEETEAATARTVTAQDAK
jgi:3D (Asp-Asp-Asp) domain-containing protein